MWQAFRQTDEVGSAEVPNCVQDDEGGQNGLWANGNQRMATGDGGGRAELEDGGAATDGAGALEGVARAQNRLLAEERPY
jgi:hypothetical protein